MIKRILKDPTRLDLLGFRVAEVNDGYITFGKNNHFVGVALYCDHDMTDTEAFEVYPEAFDEINIKETDS